jgi:RNA polymerase sigma factor (sigma-70 family)
MHDARDAEDRRLLEEGNHKQLLANYFHPVLERCYLRTRKEESANEVAQRVFERLLRELRRGKEYSVPFRVVVWMVTEWTLRGYYPQAKEDAELPNDWEGIAPDDYAEWEQEHDLSRLFAGLPDRQRQVLELKYLEGLGPEDIAKTLGMSRNAVDQALFNGHKKLAEKLHA